MSSSMLAGERRWASARRGGMTVLGKVAVPKPLNLPSQRLENHGLDPSVEIVPKGTLSWGSRSSSSTSNVWGSSTLSPSGDGGANSPSHLSGRPSSGSGTRPSTASSDRMHEPTPNAWGPNSRPASASGVPSNQTSLTSLRPRSAETRPGSSQLSRFAETVSDHSAAWGSGGAAERLGMSSKSDGFSLSSGDFPTLGSEKENSGKNTESQAHDSRDRPSSASGRLAPAKEMTVTSEADYVSCGADVKSGTVATWNRDGSLIAEDKVQAATEKWQGEPHQYVNASVPPQHFDSWRGPMNAPAGVWYRGPPGGLPPYGAHVPPGGFPIEPFPYYRPQIPPALAAQQVPPPGPGPRGHHPKNGDLYRPQIPEAYVRPGMPFRPGFYPGPMPFEGFYGPPMGYCNSNERDIPFVGMGAGPPVYNRFPTPHAPDPSNSHARPHGHGSGSKAVTEPVESAHSDDAKGPYRVLLKQHNEWDEKDGENWEHTGSASASYSERSCQPGLLLQKNEWGALHNREDTHARRSMPNENPAISGTDDRDGYPSEAVKVKSFESIGNLKSVDDNWIKKTEYAECPPGRSQGPPISERDLTFHSTAKDSTLMQKIEGLNAKVRGSDGRYDVPCAPSKEDKKQSHVSAKVNQSMNENTTISTEESRSPGKPVPVSHEMLSSGWNNMTQQPTAAMSRRPYNDVQGRSDHWGRGKFIHHDGDGWRKKPVFGDSSIDVGAINVESATNVTTRDCRPVAMVIQDSSMTPSGADEGESLTEVHDSADSQAQRFKMKEIAKQRAIQLQKEEEERTREQKAKALAKLEELNRRTLASESAMQKTEKSLPSYSIQQEQEESCIVSEDLTTEKYVAVPALASNFGGANISEGTTDRAGELDNPSRELPIEIPQITQPKPNVPHGQSMNFKQDITNAGGVDGKAVSLLNDSEIIRHKRVGHKQKQNMSLQKNFTESSVPGSAIETQKSQTVNVLSTQAHCEETVPNSESMSSNYDTSAETAQQRRKNNRSSKHKQKPDDAPSEPSSLSAVPRERSLVKPSSENDESNACQQDLDTSSVRAVFDMDDTNRPPDHHSLPSDEAQGRITNQWKSQHSRKMPRTQQANRFADKLHSNDVKWAPVRSQQKIEAVVEVRPRSPSESVAPVKNDNQVQNSLKSKRAEMERYVPKPVAKELAQQGSAQPSVSTLSAASSSDETAGKADLGSQITGTMQSASASKENIEFNVDSNEGDGRYNKQGKTHGAWRRRSTTEASHAKEMHHDASSSTSEASKKTQKSLDQKEQLNHEITPVKSESKYSVVELKAAEGLNISNNSAAAVATSTVKDEGITAKGKRYSSRGHRSTGNYLEVENKNSSVGEIDKNHRQSSAPDINQIDRTSVTKEIRGPGNRVPSQWQPKSQAHLVNDHRGSGSAGGQSDPIEDSRANKRDHAPQPKSHVAQKHNNESNERCQPEAEVENVENQEPKRERKALSSRGHPHPPSQGSATINEPANSANADMHGQHFSSGYRKNGSQNNRSSRGQESRGEWSGGQDNRHHNTHMNWERRRNNTHLEYQPVGQYGSSKPNNFDGSTDDSRNAGTRYRERGQIHSKRGAGNVKGRQSFTDHVGG